MDTFPFRYRRQELFCDGISLSRVARNVGTPFYIYSLKTVMNRFEQFDDAFRAHSHLICYALKANSNPAVLRALAKSGAGADIVSQGELLAVLKAGFSSERIVFSGVGKRDEEIAAAVRHKILMLNAESHSEIARISQIALRLGRRRRVPVALRINPDIDPKTHPHITTGLAHNKFGIDFTQALPSYSFARRLRGISLIGIHAHIGSQITEVKTFRDAARRILSLVDRLGQSGIHLRIVDLGGGLGVRYHQERVAHPRELAALLLPLLRGRHLELLLEPGRYITAEAGALITRTLYLKRTSRKRFAIVDAGMNALARPMLYGSYHEILAVKRRSAARVALDVVGPICESSDILARDRRMPLPREGDLLAVMNAGAYGYTMASNYNLHLKPPEVAVEGNRFWVSRRRERMEDIFRLEEN